MHLVYFHEQKVFESVGELGFIDWFIYEKKIELFKYILVVRFVVIKIL